MQIFPKMMLLKAGTNVLDLWHFSESVSSFGASSRFRCPGYFWACANVCSLLPLGEKM